jgi:uncharacterized phiE125 gp8 family phage protein
MTVPLSTIKSALKVDYDDDDKDLVRLREAAISLIERRAQIILGPSTETLYLARFEKTLIPAFPFVSLATVQYRNEANVLTTMPATDYWIDRSDGSIPVLRFIQQPGIYEGTNITVTYTAGYSVIPNEVVHAVIALVGHWYNNPEAAQPVALSTVPVSLGYILDHISTRSHIR